MTGTRRPAEGLAAGLAAVCLAAACSGDTHSGARPAPRPAATRASTPAHPSVPRDTSAAPTAASPAPKPRTGPPTSATQLPRAGRAILGDFRVVAYYGGWHGPALGVLGSAAPDRIAEQVVARAAALRRFGRPVLPAMELVATVAQGAPGRDGTYSKPIPAAAIARYLQVAHRHHMLLILDFQPGRGEFLPQVRAAGRFLADPSVSVALDPEWKMAAPQVPGRVVGSASAASVNAVVRYLADLTAARHLPHKLLLVHQFTRAMLPDRGAITPRPGVEIVFHADGFGTQAAKRATWHKLAFPGRPFGSGVKLFLRQDVGIMTDGQAMSFQPTPDVITYQ